MAASRHRTVQTAAQSRSVHGAGTASLRPRPHIKAEVCSHETSKVSGDVPHSGSDWVTTAPLLQLFLRNGVDMSLVTVRSTLAA